MTAIEIADDRLACRCGAPVTEDRVFAEEVSRYGIRRRLFHCGNGHTLTVSVDPPSRIVADALVTCDICHGPFLWRNTEPRTRRKRHAECVAVYEREALFRKRHAKAQAERRSFRMPKGGVRPWCPAPPRELVSFFVLA